MTALQPPPSVIPAGRRWRAARSLAIGVAAVIPAAWLLTVASPAVASAAGAGPAVASPAISGPPPDQASFAFKGGQAQIFTVPPGVNEIHVTATGGSGGLATDFAGEDETFAAGGDGGVVSANLAVTPGQVLTVDVGQQGGDSGVSDPYVGGLGGEASGSSGMTGGAGGNGVQYEASAGAGGGAGTALYNRSGALLLAAGGGGGGGGASGEGGAGLNGGAGGQGDQVSDPNGAGNGSPGAGVTGGAQGDFGENFSPSGAPGEAGVQFGGAGGGGGGGVLYSNLGYYGGGLGGYVGSTAGGGGGGGGGGTSFAEASATGVSFGQAGPGDGSLVISWTPSDNVTLTNNLAGPAVNTGQPVTFTATVDTSGGTPYGSVTFYNGTTPIAGCVDVTLNGSGNQGTSSCTHAFSDPGRPDVKADYSGGGGFPAADSAAETFQVDAPATLHVATDGTDTGNSGCSTADPCATLAHAVSEALAGDTISLGAGTFRSGEVTVDSPLTIEGRGTSTVVAPPAAGPDPTELLLLNSADTVKDLTVAQPAPSPSHPSTDTDIFVGGGPITLESVTVTGATYGIARSAGDLSVERSTLRGSSVGLYTFGSGSTTLKQSTISGALGDGVLSDGPDLSVQDTTITGTIGSAANDQGFGIVSEAPLSVLDSTIAGNQGGGVLSTDSGSEPIEEVVDSTIGPNGEYGLVTADSEITVAGSVLAGNGKADCQGHVNDLGYNLSTDRTCGFAAASHDLAGVSAGLGPLRANGGPTATEAPTPTSRAVHLVPAGTTVTIGSNAVPLCAGTDQRGVSRPDPAGTACDAGAVELAPSTTTLTSTPGAPISGQREALVADVTGHSGLPVPTGTVAFERGGKPIAGCGAVRLTADGNAGRATCKTILPVGTDQVTAAATPSNGYSLSRASRTVRVSRAATGTR